MKPSHGSGLFAIEHVKTGLQGLAVTVLDADDYIQQGETAAIESNAARHRRDAGIVLLHQAEEAVAEPGREAGEVIGGIAVPASGKIDDPRCTSVLDENVTRAEVAMNDRRGQMGGCDREKAVEIVV